MSVRIINADVLEGLARLEGESVHVCVTSPPYYGLRCYGVDGQIGLERTLDEYLAKMVAVFREVRRVLRSDGTLWLNIGDSYATGAGAVGSCPGGGAQGEKWAGRGDRDGAAGKAAYAGTGTLTQPNLMPQPGYKPKDLMGVPWRLAFALQADGWYLRSEIIWHKRSCMPESVRDRPTKAHEQIFLLAKSERYFYDAEAASEPASDTGRINGRDGRDEDGRARPPGTSPRTLKRLDYSQVGRNWRDVWSLGPEPFKDSHNDSHFATFPTEIPRRAIVAGCPVGGTVLDPFLGSGTTALVADRLQRNAIGIELNPQYAEMARRRIAGDAPLFAEVA